MTIRNFLTVFYSRKKSLAAGLDNISPSGIALASDGRRHLPLTETKAIP